MRGFYPWVLSTFLVLFYFYKIIEKTKNEFKSSIGRSFPLISPLQKKKKKNLDILNQNVLWPCKVYCFLRRWAAEGPHFRRYCACCLRMRSPVRWVYVAASCACSIETVQCCCVNGQFLYKLVFICIGLCITFHLLHEL